MDAATKEILDQYTENMKMMCAAMERMSEAFKTQTRNPATSETQRVPFPSPLEVERGDIQENFALFKSNWKEYVVAAGIDKWVNQEPMKINLLLTFIGDEAKKKYMHFNLTDAEKTTADAVLKLIEDRLISKRSQLYDRYVFHNCSQLENESFKDYLVRLRKIVEVCGFDNVTPDIMLRDRIVFGIQNKSLMKRFLSEDLDALALDRVIKECQIYEETDNRVKAMSQEASEVKKIDHERPKCKFCAKLHPFKRGMCPAEGKTCNYCKEKNHFEVRCPNKQEKKYSSNQFKKKKLKKKRVKMVQVEESDEDEDSNDSSDSAYQFEIKKIFDHSANGGTIEADLKMKFKNWKKVRCDLDTGAAACVVGFKQYCDLMQDWDPKLTASKSKLCRFGGNRIVVKGQAKVQCQYKGRRYQLIFNVVEDNHRPLLSAKACTTLGIIKVCHEIKGKSGSKIDTTKAESILKKFDRLFIGNGKIPGEVELEIDESVTPVVQPPRRIPIAFREKLKNELKKLESEGLIAKEPNHTPWVSNLLIVNKGSSIRICLDPIPLNRAIKRPHFQFDTLEELLPELGSGKFKVLTKFDAKKGFWQYRLSLKSSLLTTFWTPWGRYRWLCLPFGVASAPDIFGAEMLKITHDLMGVLVLRDDFVVFGKGNSLEEATENHNRNLHQFLKRLDTFNVRLNESKTVLCKTELEFFGHVLSAEGLKPDNKKIEAIELFPEPKSKEDLQRFLGMVKYLGKFIKNLTEETTHLRKLTHKDSTFTWAEREKHEFERIKSIIRDKKTLAYFEPGKQLILEVDASSEGLGAMALQEGNGIIGYASRTLKPAEKRYAMIEKELLAVVFGCIKFDHLIVGNVKTKIRTDHKPLVSIFRKPLLSAPKRLQLMLMILQRYDLEIEYIASKENVVADALSRASLNPNDGELDLMKKIHIYEISAERIYESIEKVDVVKDLQVADSRIEKIKLETDKDSTMQILMKYIKEGWPKYKQVHQSAKVYHKYKDELSVDKGLILRKDKIVIPLSLRKEMVESVHISHGGIENTLKLARDNIFWPGMTPQIQEKVQNCETCAKFSSNQQNPPMKSHKIPSYPFQYVSLDVCFPKIKGKTVRVLVTSDHYSDFFELDILEDLSAKSVINACKKNFSRHGVPQRVCSDNGTNFCSQEFSDFAKKWNFEHSTSSPYHQQGNGKAESAVKIAKNLIKKAEEKGEDWWFALLHHRNTPNKMGSSPAQRIFARKTRTSIPVINRQLKPRIVRGVTEKIKNEKAKSKEYYDRKSIELPDLEIGQKVNVQVDLPNKIWSRGEIKEKLKERSYIVDVGDSEYRRSRVNIKPRHQTQSHSQSTESVPTEDLSSNSNNGQSGDNDQRESPEQSGSHSQVQPQTTVSQPAITSSSRPRREIKVPSKYKDYILYKP